MPDITRGGMPSISKPVRTDVSELSSFGVPTSNEQRALVSQVTSRYQDLNQWETFAFFGGTIAVVKGEAVLSIDTTVGSTFVLQTRRQLPYYPGIGQTYSFTVRFPDGGITNWLGFAGPYTAESGYFVGYNTDGTFGLFHRYDRLLELEKLTLTAATSGAETGNVTLGGTVNAVALSGTGTLAGDAADIEEYGRATGFADAASTYVADAVTRANGAVEVMFLRQTHTDPPGSFSYSSTGTSVGAMTQTQDANTGTLTHAPLGTDAGGIVYVDPLDGSGPSGITIDPTVGQVWSIRAGWHGYAGCQWFIQGDKGEPRWHHVASLRWNNTTAASQPFVADPRMSIGYVNSSQGSTTAMQIAGASVGGFIHGEPPPLSPLAVDVQAAPVTTTELPIFTLKCAPTIAPDLGNSDVVNRRPIKITSIQMRNEGTKAITAKIYIGAVLVKPQWVEATAYGLAWTDTQATALTAASSEPAVATRRLTAAGGDSATATWEPASPQELDRRETITITMATDSATSTAYIEIEYQEES